MTKEKLEELLASAINALLDENGGSLETAMDDMGIRDDATRKEIKEWFNWDNDSEIEEYEVPETVASRIRTVKDLNDFYAYVERFGDEYDYSWPVEDQDRIEDMMDDLNYFQGEYDEENVERIFNGEEDA